MANNNLSSETNGARAIDCLLTVSCMKAPGKLPVLRKFSRGLYYVYCTGTLYR